jgi:hypothetical protein
MDELFLQLCGSVLASIEALKPFLKRVLNVSDDQTSTNLLYQGVIRFLAFGIGVLYAIVGQVDITPSWLATSEAVGYLFTGLLASLGSEIGHRVLEVLRALSGFTQNKANTQTTTVQKQSSMSISTTPSDIAA